MVIVAVPVSARRDPRVRPGRAIDSRGGLVDQRTADTCEWLRADYAGWRRLTSASQARASCAACGHDWLDHLGLRQPGCTYLGDCLCPEFQTTTSAKSA